MNFVFELPRSNKELLEDANCSNYFVKQVYSADEIPPLLRGKFRFHWGIFTAQLNCNKMWHFGFFPVSFLQLPIKH